VPARAAVVAPVAPQAGTAASDTARNVPAEAAPAAADTSGRNRRAAACTTSEAAGASTTIASAGPNAPTAPS